MREILVYVVVGLSSLITMSYVVHMFLGGLVSEDTEDLVTNLVRLVVLALLAFMAWDVVRRRRKARDEHSRPARLPVGEDTNEDHGA